MYIDIQYIIYDYRFIDPNQHCPCSQEEKSSYCFYTISFSPSPFFDRFWKHKATSKQLDTACSTKSFDSSLVVSYTELCCQYLSAHQHSQHLLCLSLHNYTSWSCFLSPPDHLFPAANLLSVPASTLYTLYNPPC